MAVTAVTLTDPLSGISVPIMPRLGVSAQTLDVSANARAVTEDRAGGRGAYDTTKFATAGAVSLSLALYPGADGSAPETFLDALAVLLDPSLRPVLVVSNDAWADDRQITVRFDNKSAPLSDPTIWLVQVQWVAPDGVWEDADATTAFVDAFVTADATSGIQFATAGLGFTVAGLIVSPTTQPAPSTITSDGAAASMHTTRLYGPATGPKLANDTVGATINFTDDLVLGAGEYVDIGPEPWTAIRNSDPGDDVTGLMDFGASTWWTVVPGTNVIRYYPTSAGQGAQAQITFRPAWPL